MHKPLRVGLVGAGFFSQFHLDGWRRVPDVEVSVLCDTDLVRARAVGDRYGVKTIIADLEQMLSQPVDLIDIITPPASHRSIVSTLLAKRVPLICQKPFALTLSEATELTEQAERQQTPLIIHENFRFAPWFREIKRLLNHGHFGSLHAISFRLRPGDGQGPRAYLDRQPYFQTMPQLLIRETAIHFVDTFRYLFGEMRSVTAHLRRLNPVIAGEDAGHVVFEFLNGASGLFDGNRLNGHPARDLRRTMGEAWIEGSAGVMRLDGEARLWWQPHGGEECEHRYDHGLPTFAGGACGALCAHVADHLRTGSALENPARDYLRNLVIQDAIYQSNDQRRTVALPELPS
jgi:D-apiose dehydrogenase